MSSVQVWFCTCVFLCFAEPVEFDGDGDLNPKFSVGRRCADRWTTVSRRPVNVRQQRATGERVARRGGAGSEGIASRSSAAGRR